MEISKKYKKIAILQEGISDESEISKLTATEVYNSLKDTYDISLINVTDDCSKLISDLKKANPQAVFNCLHGYFGEDGQIESILNYLKIPYTHSGVLSSSIAMNKQISKIFFTKFKINTPNGNYLNCLDYEKKIKFPLIVKPNLGGSSNDLHLVHTKKDLNLFIKKKKNLINCYIFEEYIYGREITVGILDNKICGVMEIIFDDEIYDYNNKYVKIAKHVLNPDLPKDIIKSLHENSLKIHGELNCNCISRLDYRFNEKNGMVYLLEINTQPGLTKNSLLPEMARNLKINFFDLCEIILANASCER